MPLDVCKQNNKRSLAFEDFSCSIGLLRFPLIVLVVFIHARFQGPDYPDSGTELLCKSIFWGRMPHCAVAAFFLFSGYLFASKTMQGKKGQCDNVHSYLEMLRRKFKSLVVPYFLWNTLVMLPHLLIWGLNISSSLIPAPKYAGMNFLQILVRSYGLDIREFPIDVPLWYVRSLILFFLFSPIFLFLIRCLPKYMSFVLLIAGSFLSIDISFLFGMFCGYFEIDLRPLKNKWGLLLLIPLPAFCLLADCLPSIQANIGKNVILAILHWSFLLFLIPLTMLMQRLPEKTRKMLALGGGYTFWIYCSHAPVATTLSRIGLRSRCLGMPPLLWMMLTCAATIAITLLAFYVVRRIAPRAAKVLCGGRLPK